MASDLPHIPCWRRFPWHEKPLHIPNGWEVTILHFTMYRKSGRRTLGAFVRPLITHSSNSGGASMAVAIAFSTNGSLIMLIVNPSPFFALVCVSLTRGRVLHEIKTIGGSLDIWIYTRVKWELCPVERVYSLHWTNLWSEYISKNFDQWSENPYLKGARFSTPVSEMVETKAIGLGSTPLTISADSFLQKIEDRYVSARYMTYVLSSSAVLITFHPFFSPSNHFLPRSVLSTFWQKNHVLLGGSVNLVCALWSKGGRGMTNVWELTPHLSGLCYMLYIWRHDRQVFVWCCSAALNHIHHSPSKCSLTSQSGHRSSFSLGSVSIILSCSIEVECMNQLRACFILSMIGDHSSQKERGQNRSVRNHCRLLHRGRT